MTDSDGAAVDIYFGAVEVQFAFDGNILCGEGFVDFESVDSVLRDACAGEKAVNRRSWAYAHALRRNADRGDRGIPACWTLKPRTPLRSRYPDTLRRTARLEARALERLGRVGPV